MRPDTGENEVSLAMMRMYSFVQHPDKKTEEENNHEQKEQMQVWSEILL